MISYIKFSGYDAYKYNSNFSVLKNMNLFNETITTCVWSPILWMGNVRRAENFLSSAFLVLDFDDAGDFTMAELDDSLKDHKRIIATTKSHTITNERYRLIIPFTQAITDLHTYKYNYKKALEKYHWADKSCTDGARLFFPSKSIVTSDREAEYTWDVLAPEPEKTFEAAPVTGKIPPWCLGFINRGDLRNGSRNMTIFSVAMDLFHQGFSEDDVRCLIRRAPIEWIGVAFEAIIKSSKGKAK